MLKKISLGLAALIAIFLIYVAMKSPHFEVSRETTINASAKKVFPYVNTRAIANSWNPWLKMDPTAKITLSGPEIGVGSKTSWEGGKQLGIGSATVTESIPNERVVVKLEYQKPFVMTQDAMYLLKSSGKQTTVTWKVEGNNTFFCRLMGSFMNMDKMVGDTFEKGLTELKSMVENSK